MMIEVVSEVIVVIVMIVVSVVIVMGVMIGVVIVSGVLSVVTFSCGASCLCRGQRVKGARLWKPYVVWLMPRSVARCLMNFRWKRRMILRHFRRSLTLLWRQQNFRQQNVRWNFRAELMRQIRWPKLRRLWWMNLNRRLNLTLTRLIFHHCLCQTRRLLRLTLYPTLHPTLHLTSPVQPPSFWNHLSPCLRQKFLAKPIVQTVDPLRRPCCSPHCDNRFHKIRCP